MPRHSLVLRELEDTTLGSCTYYSPPVSRLENFWFQFVILLKFIRPQVFWTVIKSSLFWYPRGEGNVQTWCLCLLIFLTLSSGLTLCLNHLSISFQTRASIKLYQELENTILFLNMEIHVLKNPVPAMFKQKEINSFISPLNVGQLKSIKFG